MPYNINIVSLIIHMQNLLDAVSEKCHLCFYFEVLDWVYRFLVGFISKRVIQ